MYVRVWEYQVIDHAVADFVVAYGADGDWAQLFSRGEGYVGTELYQNARAKTLFLTIDTWRSESDWRALLDEWRAPYEALDCRLGSMTTLQRALVEATR
jgi:heme-degrading monooxygenase HmoA